MEFSPMLIQFVRRVRDPSCEGTVPRIRCDCADQEFVGGGRKTTCEIVEIKSKPVHELCQEAKLRGQLTCKEEYCQWKAISPTCHT